MLASTGNILKVCQPASSQISAGVLYGSKILKTYSAACSACCRLVTSRAPLIQQTRVCHSVDTDMLRTSRLCSVLNTRLVCTPKSCTPSRSTFSLAADSLHVNTLPTVCPCRHYCDHTFTRNLGSLELESHRLSSCHQLWRFCQTGPTKDSSQTDRAADCSNTFGVKSTKRRSVRDIVHQLQKDMILTVPNVLTLCRMLMAPVLGYMVLTDAYTAACILFVVAGVTDLLDGFIARNFANQTSELGSFIDPFADKLLVSIVFLSLTAVNLIPLALTGLVITRDVCLMSGGFYVRYISLDPPRTLKRYFDLTNRTAQLQPTTVSKLNTAVQLSLVAFTLGAPVFGYVDHQALHALWYLTGLTTVVSGVGYIFAKGTFKLLQGSHRKKT